MPTLKPRITITLTDEQHEVLSEVAKGQKVSMSSIVVDLLDTAIPVLKRVADLVQAAQKAPQEALAQLKLSLGRAEDEVRGMQDDVLGQLDSLVKEAAGDGDARRRTPARAASFQSAAVAKPPSSNRGVRKPTTHKTSVSKAGASQNKKRVSK
jgi:hypothetical protein